jgi:hypothetical protein
MNHLDELGLLMAPSTEGGGITLGVYVRPHSYKPYLHLCKPTENHLLKLQRHQDIQGRDVAYIQDESSRSTSLLPQH